MRAKTNFWKKSLALVMMLAVMLSSMPAMVFAETTTGDTMPMASNQFISMPITIRDYAADGMLFEFNQVGATGIVSVGGAAPKAAFTDNSGFDAGNKTTATSYKRYTATSDGGGMYITYNLGAMGSRTDLRYCVIKYRTSAATVGSPTIGHRCSSGNYYLTFPTTGYNKTAFQTIIIDLGSGTDSVNYVTIYPKLAKDAYIDIAYIAFCADEDDANTYKNNDGVVVPEATYEQGDTAGFSLLATSDADWLTNLPKDESLTIPGTDLIENGSWGSTVPDAITATLPGGAKQLVYGAWIRTGLVNPTLNANKKFTYTEAAVDYLADYMQKTMAVKWQDEDGTYNTYFVMGHKLSDLGGTDLATKIRAQVTDGLGTYAEAEAKYNNGGLKNYTGITTWYDAAYFLLHNMFDDSTGYGKTVSEYKMMNLVQKTKDDGSICYVFNSGYDGAKYDYTNGVIYNTQTETITGAPTASGGEQYVRGNKLPKDRFDPLGMSGAGANLGYGMSGDIYGDLITDSSADWADYYDSTNYNLTMESHAKFIYYEDENLYFTFTGDDDVYLFINGKLVLDLGAAHSISKAKINLNDVAEMCGLKDGEAYDFDFYYAERHGTAANFGIETNIKIVDPSMLTEKTGYQNNVNTGYNGFVAPLVPVEYEFALQNNGEADITNLTFIDNDINVSLTESAIALNSDSKMSELSVVVYNTDGSVKETVAAGSLTDEAMAAKLMALLKAGLKCDQNDNVGEKIVIRGFKYKIPWSDLDSTTFLNTVYTTAVSAGENTSSQVLNGMATWAVHKREYDFTDYHVYEWLGKSVTLTKEEVLAQLVSLVNGFNPDKATIEISSASGATTGVNVNTKAVVNSDGSITYTGAQTGLDTFYYKVTEESVTAIIGVAVYTYDVAPNTYVLDYGLAVELNGANFGLLNNDLATLVLSENIYGTSYKITGISEATSNYGTFAWVENTEDETLMGGSLKYTPNDIMDNKDTVKVNIQLLETGATEVSKFTGLDMYEIVTVVPASIVYYEENFPGITYVSDNGNNWAHYETVDEDNNSVAGTEQSADQNSNYGSDPNYEEDKVGTIVSGGSVGTVVDSTNMQLDTSSLNALQASGIESLNDYLGLDGADSNGTVNQLVVNTTAEVMYFEFVGTGFEIISRTTMEQYAVINVEVQKDNGDGNYTVMMQKPVITESKGGDLYQVPIISITGLDKATYRVVVKAAGSTETKTRVLYIDGIRIYGPLSDGEALEYYNPEEYQAEISEIKQMIQNGQMIYTDVSDTEGKTQLVTGSTMVEQVDGNGGVLTSIENVEQYMQVGPNNELYLDGNSTNGLIAFFLTPIADYPEGAKTLEIGAHRKSDSSIDDNGAVYMVYGSTADSIINSTSANTYEIASGTEMYYTIDVNNLVMDEAGRYLVMIGTNGSDFCTVLALTNIKVAGYEISFAETAVTAAAEADTLDEEPIVAQTFAVLRARMAAVEEEPEVEEIPVNENLIINSAALRAAKVVSGKTATLTVKAGAEAETIVVTAADGTAVEATRTVRKVSGDVATFTFFWNVTGSRGDALDFTVRVYDADGLASVNVETVTVTIK